MKKRLVILAVIVLSIISLPLIKFAYDHRDFFDYQYHLLTSQSYASNQQELVALSQTDPMQALS